MTALDTDGDGSISSAEIDAAAAQLRTLDKNEDGVLSSDELRPSRGGQFGDRRKQRDQLGQKQKGNREGSRPGRSIDRIMELDADQDGKLSADEVPERMQRIFDRFDENADGQIDSEELQAIAERMGKRRRGGEGKPFGGKGRRRGKPDADVDAQGLFDGGPAVGEPV